MCTLVDGTKKKYSAFGIVQNLWLCLGNCSSGKGSFCRLHGVTLQQVFCPQFHSLLFLVVVAACDRKVCSLAQEQAHRLSAAGSALQRTKCYPGMTGQVAADEKLASHTSEEHAKGNLSVGPNKHGGKVCRSCAIWAGAAAGGVGVLVGQPFDTLKVDAIPFLPSSLLTSHAMARKGLK